MIKPKRKLLSLKEGYFMLPDTLYIGTLPISQQKYDDLQHLKKFCSQEAQSYFNNLPH